MLNDLSVKDFAIISEMSVSFKNNFNVLTGETGAGKSIIIGALRLLLGGRASIDQIRTGCKKASLEAIFNIINNVEAKRFLEGMGIEYDDELLIKREISVSGKNRIFVNGSLITVSKLASLGRCLMDISSQHEHQNLLQIENHLILLDCYGKLENERSKVANLYNNFQQLNAEYTSISNKKSERLKRIDYLEFQLSELESLNYYQGEDAELNHKRSIILNSEKLYQVTSNLEANIYSKKGSVLDVLGKSINELSTMKNLDEELTILYETIERAIAEVEEAAHNARSYKDKVTFDPYEQEEVENRLAEIQKICRKHAIVPENIIDTIVDIKSELDSLSNIDDTLNALFKDLTHIKSDLFKYSIELSQKRRDKSARFVLALQSELKTLDMKDTSITFRFLPDFKDNFQDMSDDYLKPTGVDNVELLMSTNKGEAEKSITKIASGGELSRIMLAVKRVIAKVDPVYSYVFDEVDAGIGGLTAKVIGKKLKEVSSRRQVICITHLPQIACYADKHYSVIKLLDNDRIVTKVQNIEGEKRVIEIARMLGGSEGEKQTIEHARAILSCES